jgi:hypothetical protein
MAPAGAGDGVAGNASTSRRVEDVQVNYRSAVSHLPIFRYKIDEHKRAAQPDL